MSATLGEDARFDLWDESEIRTSLETLGTLNWTWYEFGKDTVSRSQELSKLAQLPAEVLSQIGCSTESRDSIALVDRTALHNARGLLIGEPTHDPFVAIADLASIIGAVVFYDAVVVLGGADLAKQANELLGLDNTIRAVSAQTLPSVKERRSRIEAVLSSCFEDSIHELSSATAAHEPWIKALGSAWRKILPHVPFPSHENSMLHNLGYSVSPGPRILQAIFDLRSEGFDYADTRELQELILYNDIRGLFYEKVASVLSSLFSRDVDRPPIHYVGNSLRTPMLFARAQLSQSLLRPPAVLENWLQMEWAQKYRHSEYPVRMPFWINAVLAGVSHPAQLARSVSRVRESASGLRAKRHQIEKALADGNVPALDSIRSAFNGETDKFQESLKTISRAALGTADVVAKAYLPPGTIRVLGQAAAKFAPQVAPDWLQSIALRLFRRHLWFVQSIGRKATLVQRSVERMFDLFRLPRGQADKPVQFLTRLASVL